VRLREQLRERAVHWVTLYCMVSVTVVVRIGNGFKLQTSSHLLLADIAIVSAWQ
jgi:hypothetical protein